MAYKDIITDLQNNIFTITLNRPEKLNALNMGMCLELIDVFTEVNLNDDIRCVIVTGAGRAFCAGADLTGGGDTFSFGVDSTESVDLSDPKYRDGGGIITLCVFNCLKPVICAINGPAVGFGSTFTLPMDIRMASEDARFGFVFSRRGIVPESCASWFLPRIVGINQALDWTFTGRVFDAQEALKAGLVSSVHKPDELLSAAQDKARQIVENTSSLSIALTRQMMWRMLGADHPMEAHKLDSRGLLSLGRSAEAQEGVMSFLEKRPPHFPGKVSKDMPDFFPWWKEREYE